MSTSPSYVNPRSQNRDLGHLAMGGPLSMLTSYIPCLKSETWGTRSSWESRGWGTRPNVSKFTHNFLRSDIENLITSRH